jgi:hypothetical protein
MLHSTGANNPNVKRYVSDNGELLGVNSNNNDWNRSGLDACVHGFIGKDKNGNIITVQTLPWNMRGWHAGDDANNTHIGVEICEDGLNDTNYFNKVYKEAVELAAYLTKQFNWEINENTILCHSEGYKKGIASNHADVMHWFPKHGKSMDTFRADVKALLNNEETKADENPSKVDNSYLVKVTANVLNIREGAGTNYKVVGQIKDKGTYTIVETKNNWGKLKSGAGWICLDYTDKSNKKVETKQENVIVAGRAVKLNKAPLYVSSTSNTVVARKTGTYYLWDAKVVNNRIRITNSKNNVGNGSQVTGWINKNDIQ